LTVECIAPFLPKGYNQMLQDLRLSRGDINSQINNRTDKKGGDKSFAKVVNVLRG